VVEGSQSSKKAVVPCRCAMCRRRSFDQSLLFHIRTLVFVAILTAIIPLAYASPSDPSWIAGVYDADDYDDVVQMLTEALGAYDAVAARESLTAVTKSAQQICPTVQNSVYLIMLGRSPPGTLPGVPENACFARSFACRDTGFRYSDPSDRDLRAALRTVLDALQVLATYRTLL
jgi:hypothetical protein